MSKDDDRKKNEPITPIPIHVRQSHAKKIDNLEQKVNDLEEGQGKLAGDIGNVSERVDKLEDLVERPSQAEFSLHPGGARARFKNTSPWVILAVVIVLSVAIVVILLGK